MVENTFAKEFMAEAGKNGGTKNMAGAVGMPDEEDARLLRELVTIYERKTNGLLGYTIREARREFEVGRHGQLSNKFAVVNKQSALRYDFELPQSFVIVVEKHWPTIFQDRKHYAWFKKTLTALMIRPNS